MTTEKDQGPRAAHAAPGALATGTAEAQREEFVLPSGRRASVRPGYGKDLLAASRIAGGESAPLGLVLALIAVRCKVDGKELTYEDVLESVSDADCLFLSGKISVGKGLSPSPILPSSGSTEVSATLSS